MSVALVLFALETYHSPSLAGIATFCGIFPGLLVSPIAGALLDRHGRTRLVMLDYFVALAALSLIGVLGLMGLLPAWLLMIIAAIASLTTPLSGTGLRSAFPLIVPSHLWERVNALDSLGYVLATVVGPPIAAGLVALALVWPQGEGAQSPLLEFADPAVGDLVDRYGVDEVQLLAATSLRRHEVRGG